MIVVIQCAARKQDHAGRLRALDGRNVMFVAKPDAAPRSGSQVYARPDDVSDTGKSWRTVLQEYNAVPGDNPLGLLPAWQLYKNSTYNILADHCGPDRLYILSVSVRKVIESYESDVIQGRPWQIEDEADVDSRKPRLL